MVQESSFRKQTLLLAGLAVLITLSMPSRLLTQTSEVDPSSDRHTMQQIRRAVVGDKGLSLYAHNCKIVARGGSVTLLGPVRSQSEKQRIGSLAANVVGTDRVTNNLTVY